MLMDWMWGLMESIIQGDSVFQLNIGWLVVLMTKVGKMSKGRRWRKEPVTPGDMKSELPATHLKGAVLQGHLDLGIWNSETRSGLGV